jgi:hypothetical protein
LLGKRGFRADFTLIAGGVSRYIVHAFDQTLPQATGGCKAMRTDPLPYEVRELVIRTFEYFDVFLASPWDLEETVLIDDGRYSARTYEAEGHMAMWLLEIGIVQFYDPDGNMLRTVNLFEELEPQRMAA